MLDGESGRRIEFRVVIVVDLLGCVGSERVASEFSCSTRGVEGIPMTMSSGGK